MSEEITIGSLLLGVDVEQPADALIDRTVQNFQNALRGRKIELPVTIADPQQIPTLRAMREQAVAAIQEETRAERESLAERRRGRNEYVNWWKVQLREQAAAERVARQEAAAAERAAAAEQAQRLRDHRATMQLNIRLQAEASRAERERSQASINALDNEQRAYRNMWQARERSNEQAYADQARIRQQALEMATALDRQSDAYRRLTQVAAAAQRTMDATQGMNTPGGFSFGITQGVLNALGNLGPFGQLLEQVVSAGMQAAQEAAQEGAQGVAREAGAGLRAGLAAQAPGIAQAGAQLGEAVEDGARRELDIRSPSRVMQRIGEYAGEGLAAGLRNTRAQVAAAARALGNTVEAEATPGPLTGGGAGGTAAFVAPSAQNNIRQVAAQAALATAAVGATTLAVGGLSMAFVNGTQKAAAYEQGLAELSLLGDKLPAQMGEMGRAMLKLSVDTATSFAELKQGMAELQGASLKGMDNDAVALETLATSAKLAKVTLSDVGTAADALSSVINAYGMTAADAGKVSDQLWASIRAGKVNLSEIAGNLGAVASQAASLDVPLDQLLGAMALLTTKGIPASTALDYIRSALSNIQKPSKEAAGTAKELGIAFDAVSLKRLGLIGFLDQLGKGVGDNSEAMATLIGDVGGLNAVLGLLAGGMGDTKDIVDQVTNSTGSLDRDIEKLKGTAQNSAKEFAAAWERVQILFASGLLPAFTNFLNEGVTPVLSQLGDLQEQLEGLKTPEEIRKVLAIEWSKDSDTQKALKFILLNGERVKGMAAAGDRDWNALVKSFSAAQLQQQLVELGVLPRATNFVFGGAAQYREINANLPKYQQMLADALKKNAEAADRLAKSLGIAPVAKTPQPLVGQGPLLPGQERSTDLGTGLGSADTVARLRPEFQKVLMQVVSQYALGNNNGLAPYIHEGYRSVERQNQLYAQGRTAPGGIVTNARGGQSLHNYGVAADIYWRDPKTGKVVSFNDPRAIEAAKALGQLATKQGLLWGGSPGFGIVDMPHIQEDISWQTAAKKYGSAAPAPTTINPTGTAPQKSFEAYITEARRILDQVKKYASDGAAPNPEKWRQASAALERFTKDNNLAAQAVQWVQSETKKGGQEVSKYGQAYDTLKGKLDVTGSLEKLGRPSAEITKQLSGIRSQAEAAATAERKRNGETEKYRALLGLAADAAQRLSTIQNRKTDPTLSPLQQQQAQQRQILANEKMIADLRNASAKRLQEIVQGGVTPQTSLAKWEAARQVLEERSRPRTQKEKEKDLTPLQREQAQQKQIIANEKMIADLRSASAQRLNQIVAGGVGKDTSLAKWEAARAEIKRRQDQADRDEKQASQKREQDEKATAAREKQQAEQRNRIIQAGRQQNLTLAEGAYKELQRLRDLDLQAAGDDAGRKLEVERRYAADERKALETIASIRYEIAQRAARSGPKQLQEGALRIAKQQYDAAMAEAAGLTRVADAQKLVATGTRTLRDEYAQLADGMRQKIAAGKVEDADLAQYLDKLDDLSDKAQRAGLSNNKFIQGAQQSAAALYQAGIDAQIAAGAYDGLSDSHDRASQSQQRQVVTMQDLISALPQSADQVEGFKAALQDMAQKGLITNEMMERALVLIPDFSSTVGQLGEAYREVEERLESQGKRLDSLNEQYEQGLITTDDYGQQLEALADSYVMQAQAAERLGKTDVAAFFRGAAQAALDLAAGVGHVSASVRELQDVLDQLENQRLLAEGIAGMFQGSAGDVAGRVVETFKSGAFGELDDASRQDFLERLNEWLPGNDLRTLGREKLGELLAGLGDMDGAETGNLREAIQGALTGLNTDAIGRDLGSIIERAGALKDSLDGVTDPVRLAQGRKEWEVLLADAQQLQGVAQGTDLADWAANAAQAIQGELEGLGNRLDSAVGDRATQGLYVDLGNIIERAQALKDELGTSTDPVQLSVYHDAMQQLADDAEALAQRGDGDFASTASTVVSNLRDEVTATSTLLDQVMEGLSADADQGSAALEEMLTGITGELEKARTGLESGTISLTDYNETVTTQREALDRLYERLAALGPAYAEAARSVDLLRQSTSGMTVDADKLADALRAAELASIRKGADTRQLQYQTGTLSASDLGNQTGQDINRLTLMAANLERMGKAGAAAEVRELIGKLREGLPTLGQAALKLTEAADAQDRMNNARTGIASLVGQSPAEFDVGWQQQVAAMNEAKDIYPQLTGQFDKLISRAKVFKGLNMAHHYLGIAQSIAQAGQTIAGAFGEDEIAQGIGKIADGLGQAGQATTDWAKVASGDMTALPAAIMNTVGAIDSLLQGIQDLDPAYQKWKKNQLEIASLQRDAMGQKKYNNWLVNPYYDALKQDAANREKLANAKPLQQFAWWLFGNAPQVLDDAAAKAQAQAASIFNDFASDMAGTFEQEMLSAWEEGDFSNVADKMGRQLDRFVARLAIQTVMAKSNLSKLVQNLAEEVARGGDTSDEIAAIRSEYDNVIGTTQQVLSALPGYGSGAEGGAGQGGNLFGNAPTAQLGIPRIEVSLPETALRPLTALADTAARLEAKLEKGLTLDAASLQVTMPDSFLQGSALWASTMPLWAQSVPIFAAGASDLASIPAEFRAVLAEWRASMRNSDTGGPPPHSGQGSLT